MGNILGEGFPKEIIDQVSQRQKVYGSGYTNGSLRTPDELKYLNTNTSWVKLVSSVDITTQDIISNKSLRSIPDISGNQLAKKFVLFNGVQEYNNIRGGIDFGNNIVSENAYGIGGNEYGPKPMMGIISANVKHLNRGSIRSATVQIKAWNKIQFDIVDALYLRLGFNILLEWGHTSYFDNNGKYQENIGNSLENSFITGKGDKNQDIDYQTFLRWIEVRRKQTFGNYDAMFAKVSNIHWSFMHDGSYDITLDLISIGDVIESFKINTLTANKYPVPSTPAPILVADSEYEREFLEVNANKSSINRFLFETVDSLGRLGQIGGNSSTPLVEALSENTTGDVKGDLYYVRLGYFLNYIQNHIIYRIGINENNPAAAAPMLKIDTDVEDNLIYVNPYQVSMDPTVCMVRKDLLITGTVYSFLPRGEKFISSITPPSKAEYGQLMNIYINMKFIAVKMDELKDENGRVALIDLFKGILSGINGALGGINALDAFIDETNNTIKIIDKNPIPDSQWLMEHINSLNTGSVKLNTDYAKFELYGYNTENSTAGFIKDFSFKTELSPAMSTIITVGATANGSVVGENATALSRLNNGFTDRFKKTITDDFTSTSAVDIVKQYSDVYFAAKSQWTGNYVNWVKYLIKLSTWTFTLDETSTYKNTITNYLNSYSVFQKALNDVILAKLDPKAALAKAKTFQPSTGFIPFNLSLTMDGLSGMKINSKFLIDSSYLPSNYPETVDFLIKGLSHKIEGNRWTTMLESYCISKGEYEESTQKDIDPTGQKSVPTPATTAPSQNGIPPYVIDNTVLNLKKFVYPTTGTIVSKVAIRAVQNNVKGSDQHRAMDISAPKGTPVYSSTDGVVRRIGSSGYGPNAIMIEIDPSFYLTPSTQKYYAVYGHLDTASVKIGTKVKAGQLIGTVGDKDSPGKFHLHFQIRNILQGYDSSGLSVNTNPNFPAKGGIITAKNNFIA
jgi:murein DD-endopeptidase MepM/ murein hydrolase activator NlpD